MSKDANIQFILPIGTALLRLAFDEGLRRNIRALFDRIDSGEITQEKLALSKEEREKLEQAVRDALSA